MKVEDDLSQHMNYAAAAQGLEAMLGRSRGTRSRSTLRPSSIMHHSLTPVNKTFQLDFDHFCPSEVEKVPGYLKGDLKEAPCMLRC